MIPFRLKKGKKKFIREIKVENKFEEKFIIKKKERSWRLRIAIFLARLENISRSLPSIENKISKLQVKLKQRHVQVSSLKDTLKITNQIRIYTHTHIYTYIVHKLSYLNFIQLSIY